MARTFIAQEVLTNLIVPLVVMAAYMSAQGAGFSTLLPVAASTAYAVAHAAFRVCLFDHIRKPLLGNGKAAAYFGGAVVLNTALALASAQYFL